FNWKMNPQTFSEAKGLLSILNTKYLIPNIEYVICPPFIYLSEVLKIKNLKLKIGAQNTFWAAEGAYTGEISSKMLKNLGVEYVIIGHSERRAIGETDEIINKKVLASLNAGLKVILCIGEPSRPKTKNLQPATKTKQYIKTQLQKYLKGIANLSINKLPNSLIIAYEPIWAISSSKNSKQDTPQDAIEMIKFIKQFLTTKYYLPSVKTLYGGSVSSKNITDFINQSEIDGALVGHASADKKEFTKILKILNK
ncbi:triose-phosphate isomerase, partial [Candidatus Wolfebacteria bacterium CG10_big_fil_rev_8_21_14_0_10_31_9]